MASRGFTLAEVVDQGNAHDRYVNGVLELILHQKPGSPRKEFFVS